MTGSFSLYRSPNQINLTSTAAGAAALTGSNMGFAPIGALGGAGNAVIAPGSPILAAARYQIAHLSYRADYRNLKLGRYSIPSGLTSSLLSTWVPRATAQLTWRR